MNTKIDSKRSKDVKLFLKYGTVYFFVFLGILLLLIPVYNSAYQMARRSIVEESYRKLREGALVLDNNIQKMTEFASVLQKDDKYVRLAAVSGNPAAEDYYTIRKLQDELIKLSMFQTIPIKFFFLFRNNPIVVSDQAAITKEGEFYGKALKYDGVTEEAFMRNVSETRGMRYIPEYKVSYLDGKCYQCFSCLLKMPLDSMGSGNGSMVLLFDKEQLRKWLLPEGREDSFFYIEDIREGTILLQSGYGQELPLSLAGQAEEFLIGNERYTVLYDKAEYSNLKIVAGIRQSAFQQSIHNIMAVIKAYVITAIILFLAGTLFLAFNKTRRIKDLLTVLPHSDNDIWKTGDYDYIKRQFLEITKKMDGYADEMNRMNGMISNNILEKLLVTGIYSRKEKLEAERLFGSRLSFYCVVSMNVEYTVQSPEKELEISNQINVQLSAYLGKNYREEACIVNSGNKEIIILISLKPQDDSFTDKIARLFEMVSNIIEEEYDVTVSCGISDISMDIDNVHAAYLQAKTAARQNDREHLVKEYDAIKSNSYVVDFHYGSQLYELIIGGETEETILFFDRLKKQLAQRKLETEDEIQHFFFLLRDGLYHARKMLPGEALLELPLPAYDINSDVSGLLDKLCRCAEAMCTKMNEKKKSRNPELKNKILEYMQAHYSNPDLSAREIAAACGISEKYLYQFIKEQTGKTAGDLLENIRMTECERPLLETDKPVTELYASVGFYSNNTFYKAFKRIYGVSPGKWRESRKKGTLSD